MTASQERHLEFHGYKLNDVPRFLNKGKIDLSPSDRYTIT
uniref:Uncharacterized protein n=1 Tax=Rhizophora mucronata TaxID=61149 RepID=A0A2P2R1S7_RHIMU